MGTVGSSGTIWLAMSAAVAAMPSPAGAQLTLRYRAPAGCPDAAAVGREIEALLGRSLAEVPAGIEVEADLHAEANAWVVHVRVRDGGERLIGGETCAAVAEALALLVAWMLDPEAVGAWGPAGEPPNPAGEPPRSDPAPPAAVDPPSSVASARGAPRPADAVSETAARLGTPAPTSLPSFGIGPFLSFDAGALPSVSVGLGAEVLARIDRLDVRARGGWVAPQRAALGGDDPRLLGAGASVEIVYGAVAACGRPWNDGPGLAICGALHAGVALAEGHGISAPRRGEGPFAAVAVAAALPWVPADWLDVELGLELLVPLAAPTFTVLVGADERAVFTPAPAWGRLTITGHVDVR